MTEVVECEHGVYEDGDGHARHCPEHDDYGIYLDDARGCVVEAMGNLRYSGSMRRLPCSREIPETQFLDSITEWLDAYAAVLTGVSDTTTSMAQELTELRSQRKAVRDFLGRSSTPGDQ